LQPGICRIDFKLRHPINSSDLAPRFFQQSRPGAPRQNDERVGPIPAKEERLIFAKPLLKLGEARPVLAGLHLGDERGGITADG
jgi:hypothetical protein